MKAGPQGATQAVAAPLLEHKTLCSKKLELAASTAIPVCKSVTMLQRSSAAYSDWETKSRRMWLEFIPKKILQVQVATSPGCQDIAAYFDWETESYRMSDCRLMPHNNCSKPIICFSNSFTLMKRGNTLASMCRLTSG